jgi:hypothetical protein
MQLLSKFDGYSSTCWSYRQVFRSTVIRAEGEQLKDIDARWRTLRQIRESGAFTKDRGPPMAEIMNATNADIYLVDVSFKAQQG